ncbi:hypothetical protein RCH21_002511 [Arthrobacter sp. PL16]|uniref:DUF3631 domain-containing protein n=1 Tax=Arthrobacter sp. PL16 TaxID=3071720 RepID=UPI002DFB5229|nr:hypothetical protein [Arthrobacter sp. PL16]
MSYRAESTTDPGWVPRCPPVTAVPDAETSGWAARAELLDDVQQFLERFIAYPSPETATAHALWIVHAHLIEAFENSPRLAFLSPEPGSGKSRCLELTEALVPRPVLSVNASVAYIFRKISDEAGLPTLLMDEIDTVFGRGKADNNEDLRGLLNSGYRKGATAGRAAVRGREVVTEEWPSFCAVALAGLNQLPDTLMTRSVVIPMKRRRPGQRVQPYRRRVNGTAAAELRDRLADFAADVRVGVAEAWPDLPKGIEDRDADIWEPLLSVADAAGGHWPVTARAAAVFMVAKAKEKPATLGIQLLGDIRAVLGDLDRMTTADLLEELHGLENAPWRSIRGEPIDPRFLARTLTKYEIPTNNTIRTEAGTAKGYRRRDFADAFERYLHPETPVTPVTPSGIGEGGQSGQCHPRDQSETYIDTEILNSEGSILSKGLVGGPPSVPPRIGNRGNRGLGARVSASGPAPALTSDSGPDRDGRR